MTETEVRDLIDKLQIAVTDHQRDTVSALNEITGYVIEKKFDIGKLQDEITNLKCEKNDWKQRAESAEERYESLIQSSAECVNAKVQNILQDLYNHANHGAKDNNNDFALACSQMRAKILANAKEYGVKIKQ